MTKDINKIIADNDVRNLGTIADALSAGKIDDETAKYLTVQYTDSMDKYREVFNMLGRCFGAPKAAVFQYDNDNNKIISEHINIYDINPMGSYLVNHRLDNDPMRNQFFQPVENYKVDLFVSSIVAVIVGGQKTIARAIEKIRGKYYDSFVNEILSVVDTVVENPDFTNSVRNVLNQNFITHASETVLDLLGPGYSTIAVKLVRRLDKITPPHLRLRDVWRVRCLFDMIPQARTFIERMYEVAPHSVIQIRDKFYDVENPRNHRDAKIILNIGTNGAVVPLEIIVQVRTFFDAEINTHDAYAKSRLVGSSGADKDELHYRVAGIHEMGLRKYNAMICNCTNDLFDRVGWNILYHTDSMFEGFPRMSKQYFPKKITDAIMQKIDWAVDNEVFYVPDAPTKLDRTQQLEIFRWMTRFILVSIVPYGNGYYEIPGDGIPTKLFNFVMTELQRYYKK